MDSFKKFLEIQQGDRLKKSNYFPSMVTKLVKYPFPGIYHNLQNDGFNWTKKELVENLSMFYTYPDIRMKQSCASKGEYNDFKYFSFAEHGYDSEITICLRKGININKLMKEWQSMPKSDWKDISKNKFFKEFTIVLFHEYTHEMQSRHNTKNVNIEEAEKVKDGYGIYLSEYKELQAFAVESAFTKRTFGHYSPSIKIYRHYPMLWKFFKTEMEKWL